MTRKFFRQFLTPAIVFAALLFLSGSNALAITTCNWSLQYNPDPDPNANQLRAISGTGAGDVFAVGDYGTILHTTDNGVTWSAMTSGIGESIYGVWGSDATHVFAFADKGKIRFYNGTSWSAMTSPVVSRLRDGWGFAANDIFAVGENGVILRYNGTAWSSMTSPTGLTLQGVWGSGNNNVFAVGGAKEGQTGSAIILKYNGTSWSNIYTYSPAARFHDAWGSSALDVYAVGEGGAIVHTTDGGATWAAMPNPVQGTLVILRDIWGTSAGDIFAVGDADYATTGYGSIILHYNGSAWSIMNNPRDTTSTKLHGVWGSADNNVFAVGDRYIEPVDGSVHGTIMHYECGTLISLASFTATPYSRETVIQWSTASELDTAGFNLYRAEAKDGPYVKINSELISSPGSANEGAAYEFVDEGLQNRTAYYYKLEDVDFSGQSTFHGPEKATPRWIYGNK